MMTNLSFFAEANSSVNLDSNPSVVNSASIPNVVNNPNINARGGFSGPSTGITTVRKVYDTGMFSDDLPVILTGYIVSALGGEWYKFYDNTGSIQIEVDEEVWWGLAVTPDTKVTIWGTIDKEFTHTSIDVNRVTLAP
jgi:uncharacterized protein (TIGR00156 family)